jgi:shikimate dehydrogenase
MSTHRNLKAGVMGWPIGHSLSPRLHGFWLRSYGIKGSYGAFEVRPDDLSSALRGLEAHGLCGVNLTIPHKVAACGIVDGVDPVAQRIGAVNLVTVGTKGKHCSSGNADWVPDKFASQIFRNDERGLLLGRNTDAYGFAQNLLASGFKVSGGAAFVLGAGGACRAVLVALQDMGFGEIRLANRTRDRAEKLAREFETAQTRIPVIDWDRAAGALEGVELLVNTTSLGMTGQPELAFSLEALPGSASVADIVYAPLETDLLRRAKQRGHRAIDGLGMLLHQARPAFEAFFGVDPVVTEELRNFVLAGSERE